MSKHRAGLVVVGETVTVVHAEVPDDEGDPVTILSDNSWTLQQGERGAALSVLHQRCQNFCQQNNVEMVIIKASALPQSSVKLAVLESAEVRGVVIAAAASKTKVEILSKAKISRTFGDRKVDEYIKDDGFWSEHIDGAKLKKTSREAAMLILATRGL
ncbi:hypothetical protein WM26_18570 [Burkholderia cepacia]|uniref:hypothetical protein n=1 Tax=Burkholderia cepacia TaxID=292 RepID=UPI00075FD355|nr:hypothetical protein [Burkholderia cepacia]KWO10357.1 hypothetical protein WM26_18570 [Burkholderia cepacia]